MPRFDPTDFDRLLARLTPQELRRLEEMVAEARERAEAGGPAAGDGAGCGALHRRPCHL